MISIKFNNNGRITNFYNGEKPGGWTDTGESHYPSSAEPLWQVKPPEDGLIPKLYYRPEVPNDTPPSGDWHSMSTDTIGIVFEESTETFL